MRSLKGTSRVPPQGGWVEQRELAFAGSRIPVIMKSSVYESTDEIYWAMHNMVEEWGRTWRLVGEGHFLAMLL